MEIDSKDEKILYELDLNARQTDSEIAKKVKLSREVVAYRIKRFIDKGLIKNFITILNHHALNYFSYRIFFKFKSLTEEEEEKFVKFVSNKAAWLVRVRGNWTFNTMFFTDSIFKMEDFINELKIEFKDSLIEIHLSQITRIYHYRRGYLKKEKSDMTSFDIMGEVVNKIDLDKIDLMILETIQNNARLSSIEISNKINISERIIRYRIKNLIQNKVILGFRSLLNMETLNLSYFKIHFKLKKYDPKELEIMNQFIHHNPIIVYKTDSLGGWDLELEIQVKSNKELYNFIDEFRLKFNNIIENYDFLEYEKEYQFSYLNKI